MVRDAPVIVCRTSESPLLRLAFRGKRPQTQGVEDEMLDAVTHAVLVDAFEPRVSGFTI